MKPVNTNKASKRGEVPAIHFAPPVQYSRWGRIKTHIWNFVLPPQVRLANPPKPLKAKETQL